MNQLNEAIQALSDRDLKIARDVYFHAAHKRAPEDRAIADFYHAIGLFLDGEMDNRNAEVQELNRLYSGGDIGSGELIEECA